MEKHSYRKFLAGVVLSVCASTMSAQPVYKCQSNGSIVYSYNPCIGTQIVDTTLGQVEWQLAQRR